MHVESHEVKEQVPEKIRVLGTYSQLLSYPYEGYFEFVELLYLLVQSVHPDVASNVSKFGQYTENRSTIELEEAYTKTFDVNPSCALEVGWHLFGEDYVRGQFLVRMREELTKYDMPESTELPDHMTHVLALIAMMPEDEASRFTHSCVFPALAKMQASLDRNESPYRHLIQSLHLFLESLYGEAEPWSDDDEIKQTHTNDFHPGQNGPRKPGQGDPLQAFPMPNAGSACGSCVPSEHFAPVESNLNDDAVELVPLQMEFSMPGYEPTGANDKAKRRPI